MKPDRNVDDSMIHPAARLEIADGALEQIRQLHRRNIELAAALERRRPLRKRVLRGLKRARRNGWRLHRYPRDYWRGLRATGKTKYAKADAAALTQLTEQRCHDQAVAFAAALLPSKTGDTAFLEAARTAFSKAGALSLQARATTALRRLGDTPARRRQERKILGRITETEPDWWPSVAPETTAVGSVDARILHLLKAAMPHRQSGYTMRSQYIIDSQRNAGMDPVVITAPGFVQQAAGDDDVELLEVINGTTYHHLDHGGLDPASGAPDRYLDAYATAAGELAVKIRPSVIHVHSGYRGFESALVGISVARALNVPVVYEVRGFFESLWSSDLAWNERGESYARRYDTEVRCMRAADAVVTLSESMRAEIISRGVDADRVFVAPNGVDVEAFQPGVPSAELVDRLELGDKFVFGYISNLDHYREGHELLIRATSALRARGIPAVALIVGDGGRRGELQELAKAQGVTDSVIFTGRVPHEQVLDYYRVLDVFVVPRVAERAARLVTPLKPFEAMAAGIPVVVSNLDALTEIVEGDRGCHFNVGDPASLAAVLVDLYENPQLRHELAKQGREWVVETRQWSSNAARYAAIYDSILTRAHR